MKIVFVRREDYWIFPLSFFGVILTGFFLYAGVTKLRLLSALFGLSAVYFGIYIVRKNYSKKYASIYALITLSSAILLAGFAHYLTK